MPLTLGVVQSVLRLQVRLLGGPFGLVLNNAWNIHPSSVRLIFFYLVPTLQCVELHLNSPYIVTAWYMNTNISFPYRRLADKLFSLRVFRFHKMSAIFGISKGLCVSHGLTAPVNAQLLLANAICTTLSLSGKCIVSS
jgi:hypothetical protein